MHGFFTEYLHGRLEKLRNAEGRAGNDLQELRAAFPL